jgi:hypothetical protein
VALFKILTGPVQLLFILQYQPKKLEKKKKFLHGHRVIFTFLFTKIAYFVICAPPPSNTLFQDADITPASEFRASAMLLLLIFFAELKYTALACTPLAFRCNIVKKSGSTDLQCCFIYF